MTVKSFEIYSWHILVGLLVVSAVASIVGVCLTFIPAHVDICKRGDIPVRSYNIPDGYVYQGSAITITGGVAVVTAAFKEEKCQK